MKRAGIPEASPRFTHALAYWSDVVDAANEGLVDGGIDALLDEATRLLPYSPELA